MVDAAPQPPPITGHVMIQPSARPHRTLRLVTDVDLLLAHTIASVRMNRPTSVFELPASLAACEVPGGVRGGQGRSSRTRGGIAKWMGL
jgi:hypothetical protein